jgi:RNA polymerase sigma factor (sigma-70 family)
MKGGEFTYLLNRLKASDEEAWSSIQSHIEIILSSWARREKLELDWVASGEGMGNSGSVVRKVYSWFRSGLLSGKVMIENYTEYKRAIFSYCQELLEGGYGRFYKMLSSRNNTAWQRVYERLFMYAAKWLSERKIEGEAARIIYQDAMLTFFEKISSEELLFETSRECKSYFFKILEFKTMEHKRKGMLRSHRWKDMDAGPLLLPIQDDPFEADDQYKLIERIMRNSLSEDEALILKQYYFQGEKLSEIAKALRISDGNCRQKKLQALRKIAAHYHQAEARKQNMKND